MHVCQFCDNYGEFSYAGSPICGTCWFYESTFQNDDEIVAQAAKTINEVNYDRN